MGLSTGLVGWGWPVGLGEELFDGVGVSEQVEFRVIGVVGNRGHDGGEAAAPVGEEPAPEGQVLAGAAQGAPGTTPEWEIQHDHGIGGL
jgi:hypothetical protein